ncbi:MULTISPECIES: lecithin retinol acyltransferase family protein [unclassified Massilia]|uniref:lecithin retinol acyltransferase family protein n=1 Tax=unclassified Massilia TaxID=2609279 RepID=UPI00068A3CE2|nr:MULTISPECIES: lecithin retinol acyltransferase family protein [unclassified Massilia]AWG45852.1 hypothetical protein AM586_27940 [Massilia sp. WG5]
MWLSLSFDETPTSSSRDFASGDHLSSPRLGYSHHGLYVGNGLVIHYSGFARSMQSGAVEFATLDEFACGNEIKLVRHPDRKYGREASVDRACQRLGEDWYSLLLNNCEHFVNWCIEGAHTSPQVRKVTTPLFSAGAMAYLRGNPQASRYLADALRRLGSSTSSATLGRAVDALSSILLGQGGSAVLAPVAPALGAGLAHSVGAAASSSVARGVVSSLGGGAAASVAATYGGASAATLVGAAGAGALATVGAPLLAGVAAVYAVSKLWDWWD